MRAVFPAGKSNFETRPRGLLTGARTSRGYGLASYRIPSPRIITPGDWKLSADGLVLFDFADLTIGTICGPGTDTCALLKAAGFSEFSVFCPPRPVADHLPALKMTLCLDLAALEIYLPLPVPKAIDVVAFPGELPVLEFSL
jgi:hypothetical protein